MFCVFNVFISETVFVQVFISTVMIAQSSTSDQIMTPFRWSSNVPLFVIKFQNVIIQVLHFASSRMFFTPGTKLFCTISENQDPAVPSRCCQRRKCASGSSESMHSAETCSITAARATKWHDMAPRGSPGAPLGAPRQLLFLMLELIKIIEIT